MIGDVTQIVAGGTPPSKEVLNFTTGNSGIPWVTPADLSGYKQIYISCGARSLTEKGFSKSSAKKIPAGSVLFSSRAPIGYVAIAANEISTNQGFKNFVLPDGINNHFIYYYLKYIKPVAEEMATGTTFKELSGAAAARIPLIVAPSGEQKRIADKLDAVLARVGACRDRLDRIPAILKRFRQSVLAAATSGKLTENWRKMAVAGEWQHVRLPDVAQSRLGKMLDRAKNQGKEVPYLRNINVRWFNFDCTDIQVIRLPAEEEATFSVIRGDVLVCEGGEPGRCAIWGGKDNHYVFQKALHRIRVSSRVTPEWICYSLKEAADSGRLAKLFTGTTIKHLTGAGLAQFEFLLPTKEEQTEIVRRVEALFACADRLEARYAAARAQVEKLTPATLAKAFRGELVPQDPNDEPASVLLARIRAQRADAMPGKSKTTRAS